MVTIRAFPKELDSRHLYLEVRLLAKFLKSIVGIAFITPHNQFAFFNSCDLPLPYAPPISQTSLPA